MTDTLGESATESSPVSEAHAVSAAPQDRWLIGDSEMTVRVRRFDWSTTPLGPIASWPQSLRTVVAALLHARHPMFLWWGPDLIQIYNDAYVPSFGRGKHPAALGQRGRDCWPEIWPIIGPQIDAVMGQGLATWHEDALVPIFRNGELQDVYWTYGYSPVFDDAGNVAGTLVICTETTARVAAVARIEQQRTRLFEFFKQLPAGVCIFRGESLAFEFANEQYERFVGKSSLVGETLLSAMPELAGQGFDVLLRKVMETGEPVDGHEVLARQDRGAKGAFVDYYYTFNYSRFYDPDRSVAGVIAFVIDVTDQVQKKREAEELARQLRESQDHFRLLAESIPQLAWAAQPDGTVDWYNRRWYDYTGTNAEAMENAGWQSVHDPAMLEEVWAGWRKALNTGEPFDMQFPIRRHDGVFRWHLTRALPLRDETGKIVRWFGTNTDIEDSRRLELERGALLASEQLARQIAEEANRAKDDFLTTASHELRTPLNAILGWAQMLTAGHLEASAQLRAADSIERNAKAQVRLIEDILDGSRIITGKLRLELRPLDMAAVVSAAIDSVRPAAVAKSINLVVAIDPDAPRMIGDADRLQQVVWNLVSNAIKFTPKNGAVHVTLSRTGSDVELSVTDTGQGISAEFLPYVFDRFRQAEGSTTRRHGGLGLGLALVRHLVEAHGGSVTAESAGTGQGARFSMTLPVQALFVEAASPEANSTGNHAVPHEQLSDLTILVVDDDDDACELISTVLRTHGAKVTTAQRAEAALELLGKGSYHILISDIAMPEMDGHELMRRTRALVGTRAAGVPAVALTAYARAEDRLAAAEAGFQVHLAKPVDPNELVRVVASIAAQSEEPSSPNAGLTQPRADTLSKFEKILRARGVHQALQFLNSRTSHRFTGIYRIDPPLLRNLHLVDAESPELTQGADSPLEETYCSIVGLAEQEFTTEDARRDNRLRTHPARETVVSYCGVPLKRLDGAVFGTLCHFDLVACEIPVPELKMMEAAAALIVRQLALSP